MLEIFTETQTQKKYILENAALSICVLDLIALDFDFVNEFFIHVKKTLKYKTFY
jgi:hypothetical protein